MPAYSNYGAALAGYIVERVSGRPFNEYIEENIFKPLGMTHSTFRQPLPPALAPSMSNGYQLASEESKPFEVVVPFPAGSLSSTAGDMARFMLAHLLAGGQLWRRPDTRPGDGATDKQQVVPPNGAAANGMCLRAFLRKNHANAPDHRTHARAGDTSLPEVIRT